MIRKNDLQDAFVAGVETKLIPLGWGAQKRVSKAAGITPGYFNDILKKRKRATEDTRRKIARALDVTYEELLKSGQRLIEGPSSPVTKKCLEHKEFSQERACCIYQHAASEVGIVDSPFFMAASLARIRPPGWVDYLSREIGDSALYEIARKEMDKLREQILQDENRKRAVL